MRVLIAGAGIGGLTTAIALRAAGIDADVFERAADVGTTRVGGGFHLWPHALRALDEIGLAERAIAAGTTLRRTEFCSAGGRLLAVWPIEEIAGQVNGTDIGLSRQELMGMLHDALGGHRLHASAKVAGFEQDEEGVTLRLADGREERGDLLIGADGVRSAVRAGLLGSGEPDYSGYVQWQTVVDAGPDLFPVGLERVTFGPGKRAVLHHVGGGRLFWAGVVYCPADAARRAEGRRESLLEAFAGWPAPLGEAIEASAEKAILGHPIYDRRPVQTWGRGRVTLLGDAAHAMTTNTSQGGNLTIEDAVLIARLLADGRDPVSALRGYEASRQARTAPLVKASRFASDLNAWRDPLRVRLRDVMMRVVLPRQGVRELRAAVGTAL